MIASSGLASVAGSVLAAPSGAQLPPTTAQSETLTLQLWLRRAEQGAADAQYTVGHMYATGAGAPQDYIEASKWFRLAAAQGHATALWAVGLIYDNGWGVPEDQAEALRWYLLAAEKGEAQAQTNLGYFYAEGLVVEKTSKTPSSGIASPHVRGCPSR